MNLTALLLILLPVILQIVVIILMIIISKNPNLKINPAMLEDLYKKINDINLSVAKNYPDSDGPSKNKIACDMLLQKINKKEKSIIQKIFKSTSDAIDYVYNNRTLLFSIKDLLKK